MATTTAQTQNDLYFMHISDLAKEIQARRISPVEVAEALLGRAERHNQQMRVFITITRDAALKQAKQAEKEIASGNYRGPLHGIMVALKDNVSTAGIRTSHASMVAPDWVPAADATVYSNLRAAGAVLTGKTNLSEYAFSSNPAFPPPLNPWDFDKTSAGSSSGSGVAVASGMSYGAIGSDTGGSGRAPANVSGIVGFKATYGRVSRWGVFPLSYSLDHTTVMGRSVLDAALMLQATAGHDPKDENSSTEPAPDFTAKIGRSIKGMKIGFARGFTHEDVVAVMKEAAHVLRSLGASVEDVEMPYIRHCLNTYAAVMNPEAATIHYQTLREMPEKLGATARSRLDLGNVIPATAYVHAQRVRRLMRDAYQDVLKRFDVIIGPASPVRTAKAGALTASVNGKETPTRELGDGYTNIYNLTGLPAIVAPAGFSSEETPIGLQIAGGWFDEATVLQVAHAFEQATPWHLRRPPHPRDL